MLQESLLKSVLDHDENKLDDVIVNHKESASPQRTRKIKPQSAASLVRFLILSSINTVGLLLFILLICIGRQLLIAYALGPTTSSFIKYFQCCEWLGS